MAVLVLAAPEICSMFGRGLKKKIKHALKDLSCFTRNTLLRPRLFNLSTQERLGSIYHEPSDMCMTDRVMLYAPVRGLRPSRALEIGASAGEARRDSAGRRCLGRAPRLRFH